MNTYKVTIVPKGSSGRVTIDITASDTSTARRVIAAQYPGASIWNIVKK